MFWVALGWAVVIVGGIVWALWFARTMRLRSRQPVNEASLPRPAPGGQAPARAALQEVVQAPRPRRTMVPASDPVEKLKQKAVVGAKPKDVRAHEVSVLKAKLADPPAAAAPKPQGPQNGNGADANPLGEICQIVWSPNGERSRFLAKIGRSDGSESIVSSSPGFESNTRKPPAPDDRKALKAHASLVFELKKAGWMTVGRGEDWYSLELERRSPLALRKGDA